MGDTAEVVAKRYGITRRMQDEYALVQPAAHRAGAAGRVSSQARSRRWRCAAPCSTRRPARKSAKRTASSIATSATVPTRRSRVCRSCRRYSTRARRQRHRRQLLAAVRRRLGDARDVDGSRDQALGVTPLLVFRGYAVSGCEPDEMGIGPVFAVPKLLAESRPARGRHRRVGAERSVRVAGASIAATRSAFQWTAQPERRLDLDRPPLRHDRLAARRHDRATRCSAARRATASSPCASAADKEPPRCSSGRKTRLRLPTPPTTDSDQPPTLTTNDQDYFPFHLARGHQRERVRRALERERRRHVRVEACLRQYHA